jgi:hypothetical protein
VLVRNEALPLLFICLSTSAKRSETPQGWPLRPMDKYHMEALDQPTQGQFGRSKGRPTPSGPPSGCASSGWLSEGPIRRQERGRVNGSR